MRIVSWNCKNGFEGKKLETIKEYNADILVILECREKDMEVSGYDRKHRDWYGDHKEADNLPENIRASRDLGIAVFSKNYSFKLLDTFNPEFRYVIPYTMTADKKTLTLFAVWTKSAPIYYDKNVIQAIHAAEYQSFLNSSVIIIGDYNTFAKEDNGRLETLEEALSPLINCAKDKRYTKTYFDASNGYGIDDFCFASKDIASKIKITIPDDKWDNNHRWKGLSDHCPIIVDFDL